MDSSCDIKKNRMGDMGRDTKKIRSVETGRDMRKTLFAERDLDRIEGESLSGMSRDIMRLIWRRRILTEGRLVTWRRVVT